MSEEYSRSDLSNVPESELENVIRFELRHRTGVAPLDYLKEFLEVTRQYAYATEDDSWGELEKHLTIIFRNYEKWRRLAEAQKVEQTPIGWLTREKLFTDIPVKACIESGMWTPLYTSPPPQKGMVSVEPTTIQQKKINALLEKGGKCSAATFFVGMQDGSTAGIDPFGRVTWLKAAQGEG